MASLIQTLAATAAIVLFLGLAIIMGLALAPLGACCRRYGGHHNGA